MLLKIIRPEPIFASLTARMSIGKSVVNMRAGISFFRTFFRSLDAIDVYFLAIPLTLHECVCVCVCVLKKASRSLPKVIIIL